MIFMMSKFNKKGIKLDAESLKSESNKSRPVSIITGRTQQGGILDPDLISLKNFEFGSHSTPLSPIAHGTKTKLASNIFLGLRPHQSNKKGP